MNKHYEFVLSLYEFVVKKIQIINNELVRTRNEFRWLWFWICLYRSGFCVD